MEKPNEVITKQVMEDNLYGWGMEVQSNTIEVYISQLRKKMGKNSIETIKYAGYRLTNAA